MWTNQIRMTFPTKRQRVRQFAPSEHLSFIPHPHSPRHIFLAFSIERNIYRRHTYLFCVAQKNVSDVLSPAAPYSHSMSAVAWRAVFMAMGEHRGISVIVESMKRKSGVRRENDIKRDFNMMARSRSTLSYILFCRRRRCDYSLHGYTMAIVCVCVCVPSMMRARLPKIYIHICISLYTLST